VWLTVLFLPLLPLGRWEVEASAVPDAAFAVRSLRPPSLGSSLAWYAGAVLLAAISLVPGYLSLGLFMGLKALELGGTFLSAGLIVGLAGWLDETRARVPLLVVMGALAGRRTSRLAGGEWNGRH
jgi:hypothetical protein